MRASRNVWRYASLRLHILHRRISLKAIKLRNIKISGAVKSRRGGLFRISSRKLGQSLCLGVLSLLFLLGVASAYLPNNNSSTNAATTDAPVLTAQDPSTIPACGGDPECFAFTIDTRMTDTLDTAPTHYDGTATTFSIPTSGYVNGASAKSYNWSINWGDGSDEQTVAGSSSSSSAGIPHDYATAGEYQITIRPADTAAAGWMNALGFYSSTTANTANAQANKNIFKSIDTPLTNLMRSQGSTYRFAYMFSVEGVKGDTSK